MIPQSNRGLDTAAIRASMRKGRRVNTAHFTITILPVPGEDFNRYSVIIPKTVTKLAVRRNRIRRQVQAVIQTIPYTGMNHVTVKAVPGTDALTDEQIRNELRVLSRKLS